MFRAAFYKGIRPGLEGIYSRAVHWWTRSPYSHCEFIFQDGLSGSASFIDGGVRFKSISYNPDHWDFIDLPNEWENEIRLKFATKEGFGYDILGNFGFIFPSFDNTKNKYFCSEIMADCMGIEKPELFYPGVLYYSLKQVMERYNGHRN